MMVLGKLFRGLLCAAVWAAGAVVVTLCSVSIAGAPDALGTVWLVVFWLFALIFGFVRGWRAAGRRKG